MVAEDECKAMTSELMYKNGFYMKFKGIYISKVAYKIIA